MGCFWLPVGKREWCGRVRLVNLDTRPSVLCLSLCGVTGPAKGMPAMAEQPALRFAGLLRKLRTDAGLTQEELAEAAGLSPRAI